MSDEADLKSKKNGANWIANQDENWYKMLKFVK